MEYKPYFIASILIGFLQVVDGLMLAFKGTPESFSLLFSLLEFVWVPISILAIFQVSRSRYLPVSYVVYNVLGWIYGYYLVATSDGGPFSIPSWFAVFGFCFGVYFSTASFLVLRSSDTAADV